VVVVEVVVIVVVDDDEGAEAPFCDLVDFWPF
jgi:hypothetical protein